MAWDPEAFSRSLAGQSPATRRAYVGDLEAFTVWAERAQIDSPSQVDRILLRRYLAYLTTRRYARATVARKAAALRCYFAWQRRRGELDIDPARRLASPGGGSRLPRVLDRGELDVMLDGWEPEPAAAGKGSGDGETIGRESGDSQPEQGLSAALARRDDALLELLYGCGLRVAELCGLDVGDIDMRAGMVTVMGKGSRQRRVPMHDRCAQALEVWLSGCRQMLMTEVSPPHAAFLNRRGRAPGHSGRPARGRPQVTGSHPPPRPAPQLCHPPPRRGC